MKTFFQSLIMGFCFAGVYGVSNELGGPKDEPLFWMMFVVLGLTIFAVVKAYPQAVIDHFLVSRRYYEDQDHRRRMHRVKIIQKICNENMKSAELGGSFPKKEHVVVKYDDLLRIWDNAGCIEYSE